MSSRNLLHSIWIVFCGFALTAIGPVSAFAAQGAPIRTGLWVMQRLPRDSGELNNFLARVSRNQNLSGVCLTLRWNDIEKDSGKPNFEAVDKAVAGLHRLGMKYQFCLKPGTDTPQFVYNEGAQAFVTQGTNPHRANVGKTIAFPVPWDPIYQRDFSRVIEQLGKRYAEDPLCVSVVLTCANAMSAEMHLTKSREDLAKWQAMGDYQSKLIDVYKKYIDEWATVFPRQEISLHISKVLDLPPAFCERVIDYGVSKEPTRFSIQNCQLSGRREQLGVMSYSLIDKYRERAHHGFQSLASFSGEGGERMGSIEMATLNVVHGQGEYWELWRGDGLSPEISTAVAKAWEEARRLGYDGYRKKIISEGKYSER